MLGLDQLAKQHRPDDAAQARAKRIEHGDGQGADFQWEGFCNGQVGRAGRRRSEKEDHHPCRGLLGNIQPTLLEGIATERQQNSRCRVGEADHHPSADQVEQTPKQQRPAEIAQCQGQDVPTDLLGGHLVKIGEHQRIGEEDRVVEKGLRGHQGHPHQRPAPEADEQGMEDLRQRRMVPRVQAQGLVGYGRQLMVLFALTRFDAFDDELRFIVSTMDQQPARAFR
ncbi:hypothetical protein D3C79_782660 [compost metagenome]